MCTSNYPGPEDRTGFEKSERYIAFLTGYISRGIARLVPALALLAATTRAEAQITGSTTCTSSLGQSIVNESFGAGTGVGPALKAGITNLQYVSIPCPNDGQYTVVNSTSGCWGGNWHTTKDHTGDPNGYFMLINASYQPSDFYTQTVSGLCAGTTYLFSAWVMNMDVTTGALADITFTVESGTGGVLGSYDTKGIPLSAASTWRQYGFYFTVPAGASTVVLRMHNNAPGGLGNDLALDDIVFVPAGPKTSISIRGIAGSSATVCGGNIDLESTVESCFLTNGYQWQVSDDGGGTWSDVPGATSSSCNLSAQPMGTHQYRLDVAQAGNMSSTNCRVYSNVVTVTITPGISYGVRSSAPTICVGDSVLLMASGGDNYQWSPAGGVASPFGALTWVHPTTTTTYSVAMTSNHGCPPADDESVTIVVNPSPAVSVSKSNDLDCTEGSAQLYASGGGGYAWSPADALDRADIPDPKASPRTTTTYYVRVTSDKGCASEDSVTVKVKAVAAPGAYMLPTAFTPNNDGHNDYFGVKGWAGIVDLELAVYDRWGNLVFHTTSPSISWDGTSNGRLMPEGTYVYHVVASTYCGRIEHKGTVILIR